MSDDRQAGHCYHGWRGNSQQERISTRCPTCNGPSLFIGAGGHLTCSSFECSEPEVAEAIEMRNRQIVALRRACRAVLLFHQCGDWKPLAAEWKALTGSDEATTKALCDFVRGIVEQGEKVK